MADREEFQEIAHCGGRVTFLIRTTEGRRSYSVRIEHSRPTPAAWFGIYALPQGIPVLGFAMGGIGSPWKPPPPTPDCLPVFIASDSEGLFGRRCPSCQGYWRTRSVASMWPTICPYCRHKGDMHLFTTEAQLHYVEHYTRTLVNAIHSDQPNADAVIDMDQYADRVTGEVERPAFYHAEESQQTRWQCGQCRNEDDILGHYGYCSSCGYRNNALLFAGEVETLKTRLETIAAREVLKDAVSHFEGYARDLIDKLRQCVPMTPTRETAVTDLRFHNVARARELLLQVFGIDLFEGMNEERRGFAQQKFLRRNLYEHRAGVVDQEYLDASGDSVRIGQRLAEHAGEVRRLIEIIEEIAARLDAGFHAILRPRQGTA